MTAAPATATRNDTLGGLAFVALWSSGYIAAEFALAGGGAFTLAVLRFAGSALIIGAWLLWRGAPPASRVALRHAAVAGILLQGGFFGFTYAGMRAGVPPAAAGLIAGLMPLVTALGAAALLGERMTRWTLPGLLLGLGGVLLVIAPQLRAPGSALGYAAMLGALLSLSGGTLYQKHHSGGIEPRLSLLVQLIAAGAVLLPFAIALEDMRYTPGPTALGGLAWVILVNSCAGLLLYLWLLRRGAAARVAGLFYLVPPTTALMAAVVFDARFGGREIAGFALAAAGVWIGQRDGVSAAR